MQVKPIYSYRSIKLNSNSSVRIPVVIFLQQIYPLRFCMLRSHNYILYEYTPSTFIGIVEY